MRYESFYPFNQQRPPQNRSFNGPYPYAHPFMQPRPLHGNEQFLSSHNSISGRQEGQDISKIERYMQTADRIISTAQQYAPLAQQVAPMLNNLPAMWKLYKGFQSLPNDSTPSNMTRQTSYQRRPTTTPTQSSVENQPSLPKIFQPPNA